MGTGCGERESDVVSISCDCSADIDDGPSFFNETFPRARKVHKCCECNGDIKPGEKYHKASGKWGDRLNTYKTCMPCHNIREHYCQYGYYFGELEEQISECIGFSYLEIPEEDDD